MNRITVAAIIGIFLVLVGALGVAWYWNTHQTPVAQPTLYRTSHYSFAYSSEYILKEYSAWSVMVGTGDGTAFTPLVQVDRYGSDPNAPLPPSYDAFVKAQAENLCGSDGSGETVVCSDVKMEPFTNGSKHAGDKLSLTLTRKNVTTGTTTVATYGPVYVFNKTEAATAEDPLRYRALFVYPAIGAYVAGTDSTKLLTIIGDSMLFPDGVSSVGQ